MVTSVHMVGSVESRSGPERDRSWSILDYLLCEFRPYNNYEGADEGSDIIGICNYVCCIGLPQDTGNDIRMRN